MRVSPPTVYGYGPITAEQAAEAVVALTAGHRWIRRPLVLRLPPEPESPALARNLVGTACRAWDLPHLLHPARLVMSELVTNAVEHAGSEITIVVSYRDGGLHLAVCDAEPRLPRLLDLPRPRPGEPLDERGRGLRTVRATATTWAATPTPTGKTVWATLT